MSTSDYDLNIINVGMYDDYIILFLLAIKDDCVLMKENMEKIAHKYLYYFNIGNKLGNSKAIRIYFQSGINEFHCYMSAYELGSLHDTSDTYAGKLLRRVTKNINYDEIDIYDDISVQLLQLGTSSMSAIFKPTKYNSSYIYNYEKYFDIISKNKNKIIATYVNVYELPET